MARLQSPCVPAGKLRAKVAMPMDDKRPPHAPAAAIAGLAPHHQAVFGRAPVDS